MTILYIRYRVAQTQHEAFLSINSQIAGEIRQSGNFSSYELSQCDEEPENFVQRITWKQPLTSEEYPRCLPVLFKHLGDFKEDILEMRHYIPLKA